MRALSHVFSNMLGSVGGITYFNGPYHQIQGRVRTVPVQPNTTYQTYVKTAFASGVSGWELASEAERTAYNAWAQTVQFQGPLGPYQPTGRALAIAQFMLTQYIEAMTAIGFVDPADMVAPVSAGMLVVSNLVIEDLAAPGIGFGVTLGNNNGEDCTVMIRRSLKQSGARNFFKGPYDSSTIQATGITDASTGTTEFTGLVDGGVYFVHLRMLSTGSPRRYSQDSYLRCIARTTV